MKKKNIKIIVKLLSKALDILMKSEVKHNHKEYVYCKDKLRACIKSLDNNFWQWVE